MSGIMTRCITLALLGQLPLPANVSAQPSGHKFVYRVELTTEGVKDPQKRTPVGLRANVMNATGSAGSTQEYRYFDPLTCVAFDGVDCQSEMGPAALVTAVNAAGFAKLSCRAVLTAEQLHGIFQSPERSRAAKSIGEHSEDLPHHDSSSNAVNADHFDRQLPRNRRRYTPPTLEY
jgi:hypothetical protein